MCSYQLGMPPGRCDGPLKLPTFSLTLSWSLFLRLVQQKATKMGITRII